MITLLTMFLLEKQNNEYFFSKVLRDMKKSVLLLRQSIKRK